jgi:hypothetical protein
VNFSLVRALWSQVSRVGACMAVLKQQARQKNANDGATQNVLLKVNLQKTGLTCGSGGFEHDIFMASAYAPGKILGFYTPNPTPGKIPGDWGTGPYPIWIPENSDKPVYFSDITGLHELTVGDGDCILRTAMKFFKISTNTNPFWKDNFILISTGKDGGSPTVDVWFPVVCETKPFPQKTVTLQHPLP